MYVALNDLAHYGSHVRYYKVFMSWKRTASKQATKSKPNENKNKGRRLLGYYQKRVAKGPFWP